MVERPTAAASKEAAPDPLIGRVINEKFKILGFIARGGMGKVYRAEQTPLGRVCAVKVLNPNYTGEHDPEFHKRFFLEASMTSKLRHPNTVTIFDYGHTDDGIYYMAMEYLEGYTLHRAIRQVGHLPEERTAHIARQICRSLREAHSLGVVHRDLKPANVYLLEHGDEPDFVKVLDFGLVKDVSSGSEELTKAGLFMGSPKYMAPEQITGAPIDGRTDIYALGVIMYEMVTGKVPFDRPKSLEILMAHAGEEVPPIRKMNPARPRLARAGGGHHALDGEEPERPLPVDGRGARCAQAPRGRLRGGSQRVVDDRSPVADGQWAHGVAHRARGRRDDHAVSEARRWGSRAGTGFGSPRGARSHGDHGRLFAEPRQFESPRGRCLRRARGRGGSGLREVAHRPSPQRRGDRVLSGRARARANGAGCEPGRELLGERPRGPVHGRAAPEARCGGRLLRAIARTLRVREAGAGHGPTCGHRGRPSHQASSRGVAVAHRSCPVCGETDLGL